MIRNTNFRKSHPAAIVTVMAIVILCGTSVVPSCAQQTSETTAWRNGRFHIVARGLVERSDIVLKHPNLTPSEAMPMGNGRLGLAVWAADGYTAQLNRADTLPLRLSPGQLVIPGLAPLVRAPDYSARLDLYDGEFQEHGGGMTATTYVEQNPDAVVVVVTGADPNIIQTAELRLWPPRQPRVTAQNGIGVLSQSWLDNHEAGASGRRFGSLAAITAMARDVTAVQTGSLAVTIRFHPRRDGSFRILVVSPQWQGSDATAQAAPHSTAARLLTLAASRPASAHRAWWHGYWSRAGLMKLRSPHQTAQYFENLRMIDLYAAAAESAGPLPGGQAGVGDLFSAFRDSHKWDPAAYWHWNLRMQVAANLGAGAFGLNQPYFNLYRKNLPEILAWTRKHMRRPGICVPETMRFNGYGYETETWAKTAIDCGEDFHPYYNARTLTTGAEVSLWIWQQYLYTDNTRFLAQNFPVMLEAARFLLAYAETGPDGHLHTNPSNAHETQWDVRDPTTDIAAMRALFPVVLRAAKILEIQSPDADATLAKLRQAIPRILPFPVADASNPKRLAAAGTKNTIVAPSYQPGAPLRNSENIGLEPVWPYELAGYDGPLHDLEIRTFRNRPFKEQNDWSYDPLQAAYLGLADQFRSTEIALTEHYQAFPSGFAQFVGPEFYVEQIGVLAAALQSALVQEVGGILRIVPAWPAGWSAGATVYVEHRSRVDLEVDRGRLLTLGFESGASQLVRVRDPWPSTPTEVVNARTGKAVQSSDSTGILAFRATANTTYRIRPSDSATTLPFAPITGVPATSPRRLGSQTIGIF